MLMMNEDHLTMQHITIKVLMHIL